MRKPAAKAGQVRKRAPRSKAAPAPAQVDPPAAQPAANPVLGEHELRLGGVDYRLRPSHKALKTITLKLGHGRPVLTDLALKGDLTDDQLELIVAELIRAGAEDELTRHVGNERIGELIHEEGSNVVMMRVAMALLDATTGGRAASGEAKADPAP